MEKQKTDFVKQGKCMTKKELKRIEKRELKKQFKEWSEKVKERDNKKCVICHTDKFIHAHHLIPRENKIYRFDIDNGISLCAKHHKFSLEISPHRNPIIFVIWLQKNKKLQWQKLYSIYNKHLKSINII